MLKLSLSCQRKMRPFRVSPTEFINELRVKYIESLSLTTENNLLDIFLQAGFNNIAHARNQFIGFAGISPSDYRKKNRITVTVCGKIKVDNLAAKR